MNKNFLFTSESVAPGHPDKVADIISDSILDAFLAEDSDPRVAVETLVTRNTVVLAGEVRSHFTPDYETIVRTVLREIGYTDGDFNADTVEVINHVHEQSAEIAQGVDANDDKEEGAGDQGLMFGYACNDTPELMPAPIYYAHRILEEIAIKRESGDARIGPDGKSQVTLKYVDGHPVAVDTIVVSHQHTKETSQEDMRGIVNAVLDKVFPDGWITNDVKIHVNPTGSFIYGGPGADTGLTGRKIIVDTYGGYARHGGGAFSGKDFTKVDRSAAYIARYLAKNIVASGLADDCEIQLCYAIGVAEPLAIYLDTFGTAKNVTEDQIITALRKSIKLTPRGIREKLELNRPIYKRTASFGHFGRAPMDDGGFSWEKTDLAETIRSNI